MTRTSLVALVLLHFLWQGALIQGLLAFCLRVLRPSHSTLRYAVGVVAMLLMAIAPAATAIWLSVSAPTVQSFDSSPLVASDAGGDVAPPLPATVSADLPTTSQPSVPSVTDALSNALTSLSPIRERLAWLLPWIVGVWLAGVVILAVRLLGGWLHLRNVVRTSRFPDSRIYDALVLQLRQRLRVSRPVRVLESAFVRAPAVIGWLRPVLLIPASMSGGLTVMQLETILAHELAHIRRHDYAVNLFQSIIETLLFYHPAVWWVSRQIREEREHCCDDLAVATSGDARLYASALLQLETLRISGAQLALAATGGGSLLHRVRRLLVPPSRGSDASRWLAGIVVLCGVLFVGGSARLLSAEPNAVPTSANATVITEPSAPDNSSAQVPDTVIIYRGNESLDARWQWAQRTARENRFRDFWIGYAIEGDISRGWHYMNRHAPVRAGGGTTLMGHMRMTDARGLIFSGDRLDSLVPGSSPTDLAILLGISGGSELDRIHAGNFAFNVPLGRRVLIWLGESADQPSIRLIQEVLQDARTRDQRRDLMALVGMHSTSSLVRPVLMQALEDERDDELRADVLEWLGYHADERTLGLIARLARTDRSSRVRSEAAETVSEIDLRTAFDTLVDLARTLRDTDARREAVEGLGQRQEARALEVLKAIAERDASTDIQREAVEALGELKNERALALIEDLARSHESVDVRREAVETLGEHAPIEEALRMLRRIVEEDRSVDVQREAVATLAGREDRRALAMLVEIAEQHREVDVQREAIESLGHFAETAEVRRLLERLARTHEREDARRAAIETLAESLPSESSMSFLESIVRGDGSSDSKIEALEALAEVKDRKALTIIIDVAERHADRKVRKKAIQLLGDSDDPRARTALERLLTRPE